MPNTKKENGLLDFLKTNRTKTELKLCLDILLEFRKCETLDEWASKSFESWQVFEQFQQYLMLLTDTNIDDVDDNTAKEFLKSRLH